MIANSLGKLVRLAMQNAARDIEIGERTAEVHCMALPDGGQRSGACTT